MKNLDLILARVAALALAFPACINADSENNCSSNGPTIQVPQDVACSLARSNGYPFVDGSHTVIDGQCRDVCGDAGSYGVCTFPGDYALTLADGGPLTLTFLESTGDDGGTLVCPASGPVSIHCSVDCTGRRTAGIPDLVASTRRDAGEYFATSAYLESVSALAFARLARELEAHGAPVDLVERCRRAEREEIVHADLTTALANTYGARAVRPHPPEESIRSLFDVASENAVEGCVRETYGAALALVRAKRASDRNVRKALEIIARDECGHAALSWDIGAWAVERMSPDERNAVARRMELARMELQQQADDAMASDARALAGMPSVAEQRQLAALLESHVFVPQLGQSAIV